MAAVRVGVVEVVVGVAGLVVAGEEAVSHGEVVVGVVVVVATSEMLMLVYVHQHSIFTNICKTVDKALSHISAH